MVITVLSWTCVTVFILTSIITLLALTKVIELAASSYLRKLFVLLIVEVIAVGIFAFKAEVEAENHFSIPNETGTELSFKIQNVDGSIYWIDNITNEGDVTKNFYKKLFSWQTIKTSTKNYEYFADNNSLRGGIFDIKNISEKSPSYWRVMFYSKNIAKTTQRAKQLGAEVIIPEFELSNGKAVILKDPGGAVFSLFEKK